MVSAKLLFQIALGELEGSLQLTLFGYTQALDRTESFIIGF